MPAHQVADPTPNDTPSALAAERTAHRAAVAARPSGGGRPVLVVDSSAIARKFLTRRLQALGYEAHSAETGEQALDMIERGAFAIVFLEFVLAPGGIDGLSLCRAIKHKTDHRGGLMPAVVVATGRVGASDRVRGSLAGCDAYLTKPLAEATFAAALAEVDPLFNNSTRPG
jgi:two-component system cell cycle response regulator